MYCLRLGRNCLEFRVWGLGPGLQALEIQVQGLCVGFRLDAPIAPSAHVTEKGLRGPVHERHKSLGPLRAKPHLGEF